MALAGLSLAATLNHYTLELTALSVKPEHVAIGAGLGWVAWRIGYTGRRPGREMYPLAWIALFLGATLLASLLNAPDRAASLRHTAMIGLVAGAAGLVYTLVDRPARLRAAVGLLIGLGGLEAAFAFVALGVAWFHVPLGAQPGRGGIPVPYGTLWEPNVLGSYLAAAGLLTLSALLAVSDRRRAAGLASLFALILAAGAVSLARGAWIGFGVGAGVLALARWQMGAPRPAVGAGGRGRLVLGAVLGVVLFLAGGAPLLFPGTTRGLRERVNLGTYDPRADPSVQARLATAQEALAGITAHPILGNGAGSYAADHRDARGDPGWIGNLELHLLYDSGLIGLGAVLIGLGASGRAAWRALGRAPAPGAADPRPAIAGLLGAGAALLVAYQATEGTWLAFTWIYIGLLARAGHLPASPAQLEGTVAGAEVPRGDL